MPAQAGIQYGAGSPEARFPDPGLRRGDEPVFNQPLAAEIRREAYSE